MRALSRNSGISGISFKLKSKALLETAVLELFAVEFNCEGNYFLEEISQKFLRNHVLVLVSAF